jgi:hypothetical protein
MPVHFVFYLAYILELLKKVFLAICSISGNSTFRHSLKISCICCVCDSEKVSEHATWSGCFYLRIIHSALIAAGASPDLVHIVTG